MREIVARAVAGFTAGVVVALSLWFAAAHNPPKEISIDARASWRIDGAIGESAIVARGRRTYGEHDCAACHSIAGRGNPRHPLDDVGARRSEAELREWITGTGSARLPEAIVRRKSRYRDLPPEDLAAVAGYLLSLPAAK